MSSDPFGFVKAELNKGVIENSIFYHIMHIISTPPLEAFPPMSQRVIKNMPSHSFVMPFQGVEASYANLMGRCPFVQEIWYSVHL
jgi:hypothetical protein